MAELYQYFLFKFDCYCVFDDDFFTYLKPAKARNYYALNIFQEVVFGFALYTEEANLQTSVII